MSLDDPRGLLARTRDGGHLDASEIHALISAYCDGDLAEEQMAAWLMAATIHGLTTDEAVALTAALVASGETLDLTALHGPTVDKHSTGGVGDTATLVVAPLAAACGLQVAKLAGRALGHTGGTLDKLQAIPALRVDLTPREVVEQVERVGLAVAAATDRLVPADRRLYALRDRTATVAEQGLIAASVMSKKLAGGAQHIVLDVKTGDGAFLVDEERAAELARLCVAIGEAHGRSTRALVTDMSQPLGPAVGDALEVAAAVAVLSGAPGRLRELAIELTSAMLDAVGRSDEGATVRARLDEGAAKEKFRELVEAQGGDGRVVDAPWEVLPRSPHRAAVHAQQPGVVQRIRCREVGDLAHGVAQRVRRTADPAAGIELLIEVGDTVAAGQPLARVHAGSAGAAEQGAAALAHLIGIGDAAVAVPALVRRRIPEDPTQGSRSAA